MMMMMMMMTTLHECAIESRRQMVPWKTSLVYHTTKKSQINKN